MNRLHPTPHPDDHTVPRRHHEPRHAAHVRPTAPLAYAETDTATVFQDHPDAIDHWQAKMRNLASLALPPAQSHDVFAHWADRYDRDTR